jgi:GTP cyclohydrolase I
MGAVNGCGFAAVIAAGHMNAVIRAYDAAGKVIETHEHKGDFKES